IPIVCIHGHPFNQSMWYPQVEALQSVCRVITFDLRGYGQSLLNNNSVTFQDYALDTLALMDELGIETAVIMGLSMGGQIAQEVWYQSPTRVGALVLADTFAQLDPPARKQDRYVTADRLLAEGLDPYANETLPKMICANTLNSKPEVAQHVLNMMQSTSPIAAATALRARAERRDYVSILGDINVPTLITVGTEDVFTPVSDAQFMAERIPNSQLVVIEEAGHMPNLEQPEVFNQALWNFLQGL
ncbi:MAG: alpha/beta fold hydrolase, partial [Chloroflexota bacterium]